MERFVSLIRLTPKGREEFMKTGDYFAQIMELMGQYGGTTEAVWASPEGPFEFFSITTYPDWAEALKARTHIEALGVIEIEAYRVIEMPEYIQTMAA